MLFQKSTAQEKRSLLREKIATGKLLSFPGAFSPLVSMLIENMGFDGVYVSGAVLSNDLGFPDVGFTTLSEVAARGSDIARTTKLPTIIDIDTGFGETINVARTIQVLTERGLSGCHIEDQMNPKRCGHLNNKSLVETSVMVKKIKTAIQAKTDPNFLVIARTDARHTDNLEVAMDRAKKYRDAGAEMIFTEALQSKDEFEIFRKELPDIPLMANMTEFGKSPLLTKKELESLGYNLVIYPVTTLRLAMKACEEGLQAIKKEGSQESVLEKMQKRSELYELLDYEKYNEFDKDIYNFKV